MKKPGRPARKFAKPEGKPIVRPPAEDAKVDSGSRSVEGPKSSFDLVMERLRAADREAGVEEIPLSPDQKARVAEARRVAASRLAEREILFRDAMRKTEDPAEREKAEREYQTDRQRINEDCERAIEAIRRGKG